MRLPLYITTLLLAFTFPMAAQQAKLSGHITDEKQEPLLHVAIIADASKNLTTVTDVQGYYELSLPAGDYIVSYRYVGSAMQQIKINLHEGEQKSQDVVMVAQAQMIDAVVVSASKFAKKLSEETVSVDLLSNETISNLNVSSIDNGIQKVPGVTIADGQANIRGGSGWSYGAGTRVAVLYDDMPISTADADDAKWSIIPVENIQQVEVIKGATSALYGSGALNGIINSRTAIPSDKPYTRLETYAGFYDDPKTDAAKWWGQGQLQYFSGSRFADRRKIGNVDIVTGLAYNTDRGYLDSSDNGDARFSTKIRWHVKQVKGLTLGIGAIAYYSWGKAFFIWDSIGDKGYKPLPGTITVYRDGRYIIDPFVQYIAKGGNTFTARYRYLNSTNLNNTHQGSIGHRHYAEFQYQHQWDKIQANLTAGIVGMYDIATHPPTDTLSLIGNHNRGNFALYAQYDQRFVKRVWLNLGLRWEYFTVDGGASNSLKSLTYPLGRVGVNVQAAKATYIRLSGGTGFRYPSLAEMFITTQVGPLGVFSNPHLKPEYGYSGEIGIKQGFRLDRNGHWQGYADAAFFVNYYKDMMEFTFGQFGPKATWSDYTRLFGLGFSAQNIGNTLIDGTDIAVGVQGSAGDFSMNALIGYTVLIQAKNLNWNDPLTMTTMEGDTIHSYLNSGGYPYNNANHDPVTNADSSKLTYAMTSSSKTNFLKYRPRHQLKIVLGLKYKFMELNADYQYLSYQDNIDYAFVSPLFSVFSTAFRGIADYRSPAHANSGDHILNLALAGTIAKKYKIGCIIKNVLNTEWMSRPGRFEAPRSYTVQFTALF